MKKRNSFVRMVVVLIFIGSITADIFAQKANLLIINKIKSNGNFPGSLAFVNFESGNVLITVPVGNEPHEVAVSSDLKFALVTNTGSYQKPGNTLSVIDIATQKELQRVNLGTLWNPHGLIYNHGLFYFTAEGSKTIAAYDAVNNSLVWINGTGQDGTHMLVASKDGKILVTANRGSGTISIYQLHGENPLFAGAWKVSVVNVGKAPEGIDITADESKVYVGCSGQIAIVDLTSKMKTDSITTGEARTARLKFTPDGKYILGTDGRQGALFFINLTTLQIEKTLQLGAGAEPIFITPDGKHALIGVTNENKIVEVDLIQKKVVRTLSDFNGPDAMVWIGQ